MRRLPLIALVASLSFQLGGCDGLSRQSSEEYVAQGAQHLSQQQWNAALIAYKNAVQVDPANEEALLALAELHLRLEDPAAAEKELRKARSAAVAARQIQPLMARTLFALGQYPELLAMQVAPEVAARDRATIEGLKGRAHLELGEPQAAQEKFHAALSYDEQVIEATIGMAMLTAMQGDRAQARQMLEQVLAIDGAASEAWSLMGDLARLEGDVVGAEQAYSEALALQSVGSRDRIKRVYARLMLDRREDARRDIAALRATAGSLPIVDFAEALILFQERDYRGASELLSRALAVAPAYLPARFYSGAAHYFMNHDAQALRDLEGYYRQVPGDLRAARLLAALNLRLGHFAEAERVIRPVVDQDPDDTVALGLLASAISNDQRVLESLDYLEQIVAFEPDSVPARMALGVSLLHRGDTVSGMEEIARAQQLDPNAPVDYEAMTLLHLRNQAYEEALASAQANYEEAAGDTSAAFLLGTTYLANENRANARALFGQVLEADPGHLPTLQILASLALREREFDQAKIHYQQALRHHPGDLHSLQNLALIGGLQDDERLLTDALESAIKANPQALSPRLSLARYYSKMNQPNKVVAVFADFHDSSKKDPNMLALLGESHLTLGDFAKAAEYLGELTRMAPTNVWSHHQLAQVYGALGDRRRFLAQLDKVLSLDESHLQARTTLVRYHLAQGNHAEAARHIERLEVTEGQQGIRDGLQGELEEARGNLDRAVALYESAFAELPSNITLLRLENALWRVGKPQQSLELMDEWLQEHPHDQLTLTRAAARWRANDQPELAIDAYQSILAIAPENVVALNNLAWMLRRSDRAQALAYAEQAAAVAPDSHVVADTLAFLITQDDPERALTLIEQALSQNPDDPNYLFHKARILARKGAANDARALLRVVLDTDDGFVEREDAVALLYRLEAEAASGR